MSRRLKSRFAIALLAMFATSFVFASQAEARRYRRVYRAPVVVRTPVVVAPRRYYAPARYYAPGAVRVSLPRVGVYVGF